MLGSLQKDDDDEISNLVDLHMSMLGGGWKWQDLLNLLWWIIIKPGSAGAIGEWNRQPNSMAPAYIIMESLVKKKQKGAILELKQRYLKKVKFCINTPYPAKKIRCISTSSSQERVLINSRSDTSRKLTLYAVFTSLDTAY
ncbi:hypothetical protein Tco_1504488 [Tanacetum coccineum]